MLTQVIYHIEVEFLLEISHKLEICAGFDAQQERLRNNYRTHKIKQREIEMKLYWKKHRENDGVW